MTASPDRLYLNGRVYLGGAEPTRALGVAVRGGRVVAIDQDASLRELAGPATELVDLQGGLLSPGFRDAHVHAVFGGLGLRDCSLYDCLDAESCFAVVSEYAAAHPDAEWLGGGGWNMDSFGGGMPTRQQLDRTVGDRAVYLIERGAHSAWVSSAALRRAGITRTTADPADGRIGRDADGEPDGMLYEGAMSLVSSLLPAKTRADYAAGLRAAEEYLFSLGVVGWQDALIGAYGGFDDPYVAYDDADRAGELRADVVGALWWDRERGIEQIDELVARRDGASGLRFRASSVKLMLDGVVEARTASMVHGYHDGCGHPTPDRGLSFIDKAVLLDAVTRLDALGFQPHFHALGDQAVRDALDAVEAARRENGRSRTRPHLAHLQVIQPEDLPRFRLLDAIANIQPLWGSALPERDELVLPQLGDERKELQWLYGSLQRSGARLAAGSDWSVSTPDPLAGMHVAVNRRPPEAMLGRAIPAFLPNEALTLDAAWQAYTAGSAAVCHADDSGRLAVGLRADLVQLDRDPFLGDPSEIHAARVVRTVVDGRDVHVA